MDLVAASRSATSCATPAHPGRVVAWHRRRRALAAGTASASCTGHQAGQHHGAAERSRAADRLRAGGPADRGTAPTRRSARSHTARRSRPGRSSCRSAPVRPCTPSAPCCSSAWPGDRLPDPRRDELLRSTRARCRTCGRWLRRPRCPSDIVSTCAGQGPDDRYQNGEELLATCAGWPRRRRPVFTVRAGTDPQPVMRTSRWAAGPPSWPDRHAVGGTPAPRRRHRGHPGRCGAGNSRLAAEVPVPRVVGGALVLWARARRRRVAAGPAARGGRVVPARHRTPAVRAAPTSTGRITACAADAAPLLGTSPGVGRGFGSSQAAAACAGRRASFAGGIADAAGRTSSRSAVPASSPHWPGASALCCWCSTTGSGSTGTSRVLARLSDILSDAPARARDDRDDGDVAAAANAVLAGLSCTPAVDLTLGRWPRPASRSRRPLFPASTSTHSSCG